MRDHTFGGGPDYQIPDALWAPMVRVLPSPKGRKQEGRPRMEDRHAMTAIV
jgi:transposase